MTRLVSLIIPVHNGGEDLREALESVRAQTWLAWECLCVDDASTDASQDLLADFCRGNARFRLICQRNTGICGARNRGLDALRGDAFMHMDQDDLLAPFALSAMVEARERSGLPLVCGRMLPFEGDRPPAFPPASAEGRVLDRVDVRAELMGVMRNAGRPGMNFPSWNKLYDRPTFGDIRFLSERYGDDTYYTPRVCLSAPGAFLLDATTYLWRTGHVSGSSGTCNAAWIRGYTRALKAALALDPDPAYHACWRGMARWMLHYIFYAWIVTGHVRRDPEVARLLREEVATLLATPLPITFRWRLRLWALRFGLWRTARLLFGHGRPSPRYAVPGLNAPAP